MAHRIKTALATAGACAVVLGTAGMATADSGAQSAAVDSPGIVSGNVIQAPIHLPAHVCGNTISVIGLLNPAFGNPCVSD